MMETTTYHVDYTRNELDVLSRRREHSGILVHLGEVPVNAVESRAELHLLRLGQPPIDVWSNIYQKA